MTDRPVKTTRRPKIARKTVSRQATAAAAAVFATQQPSATKAANTN